MNMQATLRRAGRAGFFAIAFVLLLGVRSSLDPFTTVRFGPVGLNVPALAGLAFLALAGAFFATHRSAVVHGIIRAWAIWLAILLPSVLLALQTFGRAGFGAGREWLRLATIPAVFFLAFNLAERLGGRRAVRLLFLALPVPLAAAFYQQLFHKEFVWAGEARVFGTMAHPNSLGLFLILFIGLTIWEHRRSGNPLWLILLFIEMFYLVATINISGFLMFGFLLAWLAVREKGRGKALAGALALIFIVIVSGNKQAPAKLEKAKSAASPAAAAKFFQPAKISQPGRNNQPKTGSRPGPVKPPEKVGPPGQVDSSLTWRYANWRNLVALWAEKPLLGHGLQSTSFINPWVTQDGIGFAPHNDFLRYLVEAGLLGLLGWLALLAACGWMLARSFLSSGSPQGRDLVWLVAGIFLAWQAGSFGDNMISTTVFQLPFWAAMGIALRTAEDRETDTRAADPGRTRRLVSVYPIDDRGLKIGGVETFIRASIKSAPAGAALGIAGVTSRRDGLKPGRWHEIDFEGRGIRFFPVLRVDDPNGRPRVPLTLRFTAGLLRNRRRMVSGGDSLLFHRVEPALALSGFDGPKALIIHGNASHLESRHCESRWRSIRSLYFRLEPLVVRAMDRIFLVSRAARDDYVRRYPALAGRFGFLPTVFDGAVFRPRPEVSRAEALSRFDIPDDGPVLVSVGRLEKAKDPALLLDVFARLRRDVPAARLAFIGAGTLEPDLRGRAREMGIDGRTHWLGLLPQPRIAELLNAADLFMLTSAFEGMPLAVLEALACGLPVVMTAVGEIPAPLADGRAGRVVASRSADELAAAAREVLERRPDPALWLSEMSAYGSDRLFGRLASELDGIRDDRT